MAVGKQAVETVFDTSVGPVYSMRRFVEELPKRVALVGILGPAGSTDQRVRILLNEAFVSIGENQPLIFVTNGTKKGTGGILTETASDFYYPVLGVLPVKYSAEKHRDLTWWHYVPTVDGMSYWGHAAQATFEFLHGLVCFGGGCGTLMIAAGLADLNHRRAAAEDIDYLAPKVALMAAVPVEEPEPRVVAAFKAGIFKDVGGVGVLEDPDQIAGFILNVVASRKKK